ncbi:MAG: exodeoxyribonuclease VII small subunit [Candidatus Aureabacteria bacterium]|nr:exodeoxyribonuclease VII small subunit [Candidatus Auribacterota bacterium]
MTENTFEQMMEEIESIVAAMEKGTLSLDDSLKNYENGMKLIQACTKKLLAAEKSIKIMEKDFQNNLKEAEFDEHEKQDGSETVNAFVEKTGMKKSPQTKNLKKRIAHPESVQEKETDPNDPDLDLF